MASQTQGIQQLLAAEKRAAEKVSDARKRKFFYECFLYQT
jgi:V-type H+-transporting ATPase subunit G